MNAKPRWLQGVFERANTTQTYHFETGDTLRLPRQRTLDEHAKACSRAHADVQVAKAVLDDARNHVVDCEGELMKAELALEEAQSEYSAAAGEIPGVPVGGK